MAFRQSELGPGWVRPVRKVGTVDLRVWTGAAQAYIDQGAQRYTVQALPPNRACFRGPGHAAPRVIEESRVTQVDANSAPEAPPRAAAAANHHHGHHHHRQHYRHSTASLLAASVFTRLAVVASLTIALWIAIVWALA